MSERRRVETPEPSDPVEDYLRDVERVPPLTSAEERELWDAFKGGDDSGDAYKRLMEANLGLLRAVEKFDPSEGGDFATFANRRIEDAIVGVLPD